MYIMQIAASACFDNWFALLLHINMVRNTYLIGDRSSLLFGFMLFLVFLMTVSAPAEEQERPNILFIYADDHTSQSISAYGSRINETPNIDRLAREGMRFDNNYVTNSICAPMRAVIQTGQYSHLNGVMVNGNRFDPSQTTFPKLLQKGGYQTAVIGKWHLGSEPEGFDHFQVLYGQGPYYNPPLRTPNGRKKYTGYTPNVITEQTLDWLKNDRNGEDPFMLMYQFKAPHRNWQPGPNYLNMYDDEKIPEPPTLFDDYEGRGSAAQVQDMTIAETLTKRDLKLNGPPGRLTDEQARKWKAAYGPKNEAYHEADLEGKEKVRWKYQRYIKDYLRCVAAIDDNVGRVLDYLDQTGLAENTIVVYSADQGFYLGEHGWFDKRWMYEQSLRAPLLVRWPGVTEPGRVNTDIVSPLDFPETFLDVAGVDVPDEMQGRSLVPLLKGNTPDDWREYFYYQYYEFPGWHYVRRHYGVTDGRYKLIHYYNLNEWEMFDLKFDPYELNSIYGNPVYQNTKERLKKHLKRLRNELKVPEQDPAKTFRENLPPRNRSVPEPYRDLPMPERPGQEK